MSRQTQLIKFQSCLGVPMSYFRFLFTVLRYTLLTLSNTKTRIFLNKLPAAAANCPLLRRARLLAQTATYSSYDDKFLIDFHIILKLERSKIFGQILTYQSTTADYSLHTLTRDLSEFTKRAHYYFRRRY